MKKENLIAVKSFDFAPQIIMLFIALQREKEYILSKQLLRSGTSIGANIEESEAAQSKKISSIKCLLPQKKRGKQSIGFDC